MTIEIRVFCDKDDEWETARNVTNAIESIIVGKQANLKIRQFARRHAFGIDLEKQ